MAESHKFEIEQEVEPRKDDDRGEGSGGGCFGGCLKGCFIVLLIMVVLIVILGYVVSQNWRNWGAEMSLVVVDKTLDASNIPEQEQTEISSELARPLNALRDGTLTLEQLQQLSLAIIESPLMPSLGVSAIETHYFNQSTLTAEEKQAGSLALRRFTRGVITGKIDEPAVERVLSYVADRQGNRWEFRKKATDEELRQLIATATQEADQAGIPEQVELIDPSEEVRKIIDAVMGPADLGEIEINIDMP
jgi:nucleotide-binding universal stress UspA family protein